jgi:hypothetical protein
MVDIADQARRVARMTPLDESSLTTAKSVNASIRDSNAATRTAPPSSYISAFFAARVGALQHDDTPLALPGPWRVSCGATGLL